MMWFFPQQAVDQAFVLRVRRLQPTPGQESSLWEFLKFWIFRLAFSAFPNKNPKACFFAESYLFPYACICMCTLYMCRNTHMYIYIYTCMCMCMCEYKYIHLHMQDLAGSCKEPEPARSPIHWFRNEGFQRLGSLLRGPYDKDQNMLGS